MCSRNMKTSPYNKKIEITYCISGLVKWGGTMCVTAEEWNDYVYCFWSPVCKEGGFPGLSCYMSKMDLWCESIPKTLWYGRPLHLVSQQWQHSALLVFLLKITWQKLSDSFLLKNFIINKIDTCWNIDICMKLWCVWGTYIKIDLNFLS